MSSCPLRNSLYALFSSFAEGSIFPVVSSFALMLKHTCEILVPVPAERWIVNDLALAGAVSETVSLAAPEIV